MDQGEQTSTLGRKKKRHRKRNTEKSSRRRLSLWIYILEISVYWKRSWILPRPTLVSPRHILSPPRSNVKQFSPEQTTAFMQCSWDHYSRSNGFKYYCSNYHMPSYSHMRVYVFICVYLLYIWFCFLKFFLRIPALDWQSYFIFHEKKKNLIYMTTFLYWNNPET